MKLELSENLRRLRRERELSQEQLAEKLGVSVSSLSRWETGSTYPDIEMLPTLAGFFGTSIDELLGISSALREERRLALWAEYENIEDWDEHIAFMRRAFAEMPTEWAFAWEMCDEMAQKEETRAESCHIAYDVLDRCTDTYWRSMFTRHIVKYENDDNVYNFIKHSTTQSDSRTNTLIEERYRARGKWELYDSMHRYNAIMKIQSALACVTNHSSDPAESIGYIRANLEFLNTIVGIDEKTRHEHPVLADGVPDMWQEERVINGMRLSCRLAATGQTYEALDILEETVEVWVRFFTLPDGSEVAYRLTPNNAFTAKLVGINNSWRRAKFNEHIGFMPAGEDEFESFKGWSPADALIRHQGWEWFDSIREHPRFVACVERVQRVMDEVGIKLP